MFSIQLSEGKEDRTGFYINNYSCLRLVEWRSEGVISICSVKYLTYYCKPLPQLMRITTIKCINFSRELANKQAAGLNFLKQ